VLFSGERQQAALAPATILRTLSGNQVYKGLRPLID
jgi:hypothetical protein